MIDADDSRFKVEDLRRFKADAEREAARLVGKPKSRQSQIASLLSRQLRDQRLQLCGPFLAAIDDQLSYLPHWEMVVSNRSYLGQVLVPYPRPIVSDKLATAVANVPQASVAAAQQIEVALDRLRRFQATVAEIRQWLHDDVRRHGLTKDFGDEYYASVVGVSEWLTEAKTSLIRARNELLAYIGEDVGA